VGRTPPGRSAVEGKTLQDFRRTIAPRPRSSSRAVAKSTRRDSRGRNQTAHGFLRTPLGEKLRAESATKRIATLSEQFLAAIAAELSTYLGGAAALGR